MRPKPRLRHHRLSARRARRDRQSETRHRRERRAALRRRGRDGLFGRDDADAAQGARSLGAESQRRRQLQSQGRGIRRELQAEVAYRGFTTAGELRRASFMGLRDDE
jgi:hypothetical protein